MLNALVRPVLRKMGVDLVRYNQELPRDFNETHRRIYRTVQSYTMTSPARIYALIEAIKHISQNRIDGALVECGVWKGGSIMAMALTLQELSDTNRDLYLYDTFAGMSEPSGKDISVHGQVAVEKFNISKVSSDSSEWAYSPLDEVRENVFGTGYPKDRFHFVQGKVEDTIPGTLPEKIALLRLDTDWYESTKHELEHLFPLLSARGVLILDDYGHWQGSKEAADEYFSENNVCILLNRVDGPGRISIKT